MSQALYRKYRSKSFADVVGQDHITSLLNEAVKRGVISHAYLFTGPRGTGKTSVARILAHTINDLPYEDDSTHLDIIEIDAASNRRIDDIRDLRDKVHIAPTSAKYKVYIIDEVHMLTGESFNALLKTLEEPPAHVIFILATTELHKVPATIISRTQRFHFRPGTTVVLTQHLKNVASAEHINISEEALQLIAEHGDGSFRDSLSILDQVSSLSTDKITDESIEHLLGLASKKHIQSISEQITTGAISQSIRSIEALLEEGVSIPTLTMQLVKHLSRQAPQNPHLYHIIDELLDVPRSYTPHMKLLSVIAKAAPNPSPSTEPTPEQPLEQAAPPTQDDTAEHPQKTSPDPTLPHTETIPEWDTILGAIQKRAPALYSVLKRATVDVSREELRLSFSYLLHRKKMQDAKYRDQLLTILKNDFAYQPEIIVEETEKKPMDADVAAVTDIMGGGEVVDATD